MTATAPAHRVAPQVTQTPDPDTPPQSQAAGSAVEAGTARPRLRDQIAENPLLSLVGALLTLGGTAIVALLLFTLTSINTRIDGVEVSLGDRIDRLDARLSDRIDGVEVSLGDRIDGVEVSLGDRIDGVEVSLGDRIDGVEVRLGERIDRVEMRLSARMDRLEDKMDAGFAAQGAAIAENDRKLTALVAMLNVTAEVDAALEGRLLIPGGS